MKQWCLVAVLVCWCASAHAQDTAAVLKIDGFSQEGVPSLQRWTAGALVGTMLGFSLVWSYNAWWKNTKSSFFFKDEHWWNGEHLGVDKAGHLYTSYFYFHTFRNVMLWGGFKPSQAFWWAAGTTYFFAVAVEIGDGLGNVGFDYQDLTFNTAGLAFAMLQTEYPFLRNFSLKWSYVPPDGFEFPPRFTKHYDGHTYWLAFNLHNLLPKSLENYWPEFLQPAIGYGVDDNITKREFVIGLDFNLQAFTAPNEDLLLLERVANRFHLPAPAVKFTEDKEPKYYLLHLN